MGMPPIRECVVQVKMTSRQFFYQKHKNLAMKRRRKDSGNNYLHQANPYLLIWNS